MKGPEQPKTKYRKDYRPPAYLIDRTELRFELDESHTDVLARLEMRRNPAIAEDLPLILDGEELELLSIAIDGVELASDQYRLTPENLTLLGHLPDTFLIETRVRILPQNNTHLSGLYKSGGKFCTQCEAEGFRRITFYLDRPDVMARFLTTLVADKKTYPLLLSNGNPIERKDHGERHSVTWEDPYPKPCYLFAMVAGDLDLLEDHFVTRSGREVVLQIFVDKGEREKCQHAMESLKKSMRWDEERYGLEYDLDIYMIVAVSDFNMGAMENKGLNIFNTKFILAHPETATDVDFDGVESVVAHEYFHNWTGNRVTCRDWFQLSLKEGLTVYRDEEFTSDLHSRAVKRIDDVKIIRTAQFSEDAGPMAHPIRPDSYIEMNNFYTVTVYNKGAEVIRMIETIIGRENFRKGMELYFERHDGQAVTCDDFVQAMQDASGCDLAQFRRWYSQAGTPELEIGSEHDPDAKTYTLIARQSCPPTPGQPDKQPFHIPLKLGLLGPDGSTLVLHHQGAVLGGEAVLQVREPEERFVFDNVPERPTPSLLRDFSAPVRLHYQHSDEELAFLFGHDDNAFNRWDAGQQLALGILLRLVSDFRSGRELLAPAMLLEAMRKTLNDPQLEPALVARAITLPEEGYLAEIMDVIDVVAIRTAREFLRQQIARALHDDLVAAYHRNGVDGEYRFVGADVGRRALKNACLSYLMTLRTPEIDSLCHVQYREANNMTERFAAFRELVHRGNPYREAVIGDFFIRFETDALVLDKWFFVQATSPLPGTLADVRALLDHPAFSMRNPNKVRSLIGAFAHNNPVNFHAEDGSGYQFVAGCLRELNGINPQIAARIASAFNRWKKYLPAQQILMRTELEQLVKMPEISKDVFEIAEKALH